MSDGDNNGNKSGSNVIDIFSRVAKKETEPTLWHTWLAFMEQEHSEEEITADFPEMIVNLHEQIKEIRKQNPQSDTPITTATIALSLGTDKEFWKKCVESYREEIKREDPEEYDDICGRYDETYDIAAEWVAENNDIDISDIEKEASREDGISYLFELELLLKSPQYDTFVNLFHKHFPDILVDFDIEDGLDETNAIYPVIILSSPENCKSLDVMINDYLIERNRSRIYLVKPDNKPPQP